MFHSRGLNNRINKIHKRALRIVYRDNKSPFETLLEKDQAFTIHHKNIQKLGIEFIQGCIWYFSKNYATNLSHETGDKVSMGKYISNLQRTNCSMGNGIIIPSWP